jgi:hypothetical protein
MPKAQEEEEEEKSDWLIKNEVFYYKRTSISGTKKAQITFPLRHFFPLKVVPLIEVLLYIIPATSG